MDALRARNLTDPHGSPRTAAVLLLGPGRFPGSVDPRKPESITRFARNPLIARVRTELDIDQDLGEGIRRIYAGMRSVGFTDLVYEQTSGAVLPNTKRWSARASATAGRLAKALRYVLEALQQ